MNQIVLDQRHFEKDANAVNSLIHLLNGKPDSSTETYDDSISVDKDYLKALSDKVDAKLTTLSSETLLTVSVALSENKVLEFASWKAFYEYDWNIGATVKNIHFKWDFFIKLPDYLAPQRHTLSVKVLTDCHFTDLLPLMFSGDPDKIDKLNEQSCTVIARVDFINHTLGQELLNIVRAWNKALPTNDTVFKKIKKYTRFLGPLFELSVQMIFLATYTIIVAKADSFLRPIFSNAETYLLALIFGGFMVHRYSWIFCSALNGKAQKKFMKAGSIPNIILTSGDKKALSVKTSKRKAYIVRLVFEQTIGIILNFIILGTIIAKK